MSDKQLQFHTWVKDSDQSGTGNLGIRIRCIRSGHDHPLTVVEKELKTYGVPDFQYTSQNHTEGSDLADEGHNSDTERANPPLLAPTNTDELKDILIDLIREVSLLKKNSPATNLYEEAKAKLARLIALKQREVLEQEIEYWEYQLGALKTDAIAKGHKEVTTTQENVQIVIDHLEYELNKIIGEKT